jgi:hypothetical protein
MQPVPVVSSTAIPTIPSALTTALNVPVQQNNDLIGIISQPISSIAQNPVISLPVSSSQVSQMASVASTSTAAASAPVGPTQRTDQRISELKAYMKRMESLLIRNLSAIHNNTTPTVDSTSNLPQSVPTTTSLPLQQGTSSRISQTRLNEDSDDEALVRIRRRTSEDIRDIHRRASPLNYLNFTSSNSRAYQSREPFGISMADHYSNGMGVNSNDNFIVPAYSSGRNNMNSENGSINPLVLIAKVEDSVVYHLTNIQPSPCIVR